MPLCSGKYAAILTFGTACLLLGTPAFSLAQTETERAGARSVAEAGLTAYTEGRYAEAYDLLNRAETLVHALPHLLYMARASEKQGQLVRAKEIYLKIGREQLVAGAPRAFLEAQQQAEQELRALESRLPYVTINVEGAPSGTNVQVLMDDREVPSVLIGVPFPADPGTHNIVAKGPGVGSSPVKLTLKEATRERVTLTVTPQTVKPKAPAPPSKPNSAPETSPSPSLSANANSSPVSDQGTTKGSASHTPILAYTALGVGAVGLGLGTVFLIQRGSTQSDADSGFKECKTTVCSQKEIDSILDKDKKSATFGTLSLVGFGVGAAAVSAGLYLLLTHDSKSKTASTQIVPYVGVGQAGATVTF
jgi:hypothetical protein